MDTLPCLVFSQLLFHHFLISRMFFQSFCHLCQTAYITDQDDTTEPVIQEIEFLILFFPHILKLYGLIDQIGIFPIISCREERGPHSMEVKSC